MLDFFRTWSRRSFLTHAAAMGSLTAFPSLTSCSKPQPLVVSVHPWIGYETLYLAEHFKWLPDLVSLSKGTTATDSLAALKHGTSHAACLTLDEVLRARAQGLDLTVILVFDVSAGADMVLADTKIQQLSDLRGRRLGYEKNALGELILQRLLEAARLSPFELTLVDLPIEQQIDAWRRGGVDALITYEPTATLALRDHAHLLFDSRQMPDTIFDVLAIPSALPPDRTATIKALIASHYRSLDHIRRNRVDAVYRIAAFQDITPEEVESALSGVFIPSLASTRDYLKSPTSGLKAAAATLSKLMTRQGILPKEDDLRLLLSAAWLPPDEE